MSSLSSPRGLGRALAALGVASILSIALAACQPDTSGSNDSSTASEYVTVPKAGHSVYFENARQFNDLVGPFLARHLRGSS